MLYGEGDKPALDTLYAAEMERLAAAYPNDLEAQVFYALALLGLSQGDRDVPTYMEAGAIALAAFGENPDHPGAAHYTIHSFDDPTHAILAMKAARAYSLIAPDAGHAQHMTTQLEAERKSRRGRVFYGCNRFPACDYSMWDAPVVEPCPSCGHYNEWLMYGLDQQGRYELAAEKLADCLAQSLDTERSEDARRSAGFSFALMRGRHLADARDSSSAVAMAQLEVTEPTLTTLLIDAWGHGVAALYGKDRGAAETKYAFLLEKGEEAPRNFVTPYVPVWQGTLNAMLLADAGELDAAINAARRAADYEASLPIDFGPPIALKPARELEGELHLEHGQAAEAMSAFQRQLGRTPNRIVALGGFARASVAAGRADLAERAYRALAELLSQADANQPELVEANAFLSRLAQSR
ncbi:MAG: type I DNA topoisomerase [Gemmatimonadales bacterium]